MATRDDTEYFSVREYASLAMASVAADPAALLPPGVGSAVPAPRDVSTAGCSPA